MFRSQSHCALLTHALAVLALTAATWLPAHAAEPVLKNAEVTESALINALALEELAGPGGTTRGFKPAAVGKAGSASGQTKPASHGRASLLIVFETGKSTLTPESQAALATVAKALQSDTLAGLAFRVEGHADLRGTADANQRLSQARAEAVVEFLQTQHGILPERLMAVGKGSAEPMNTARADAPENRRVTLVSLRN
jgi:OOP family OmpA-OmpF porin